MSDIETHRFHDLQLVEDVIMDFDRDYRVIRHSLKAGEIIPEDVHLNTNEWIVLSSGMGMCEITIDDCAQTINQLPKEVVVISVRKGSRHSFKAWTDIDYRVIKDGPD